MLLCSINNSFQLCTWAWIVHLYSTWSHFVYALYIDQDAGGCGHMYLCTLWIHLGQSPTNQQLHNIITLVLWLGG